MDEISSDIAVDCAKRCLGLVLDDGRLMVDMGSYIGEHWNRLDRNAHVMIGRYCSIGQQVAFCAGFDHDYRRVTTSPLWIHGIDHNDDGYRVRPRRNHILIGNDVWIGDSARIMGGVIVGNGAVIGAGALVKKNVPPYAIVAGNPAHIIKYRFPPEIIAKLQRIKFWRWPYEKFQENLPLLYTPEAFVQKHDTVIQEDQSEFASFLKKERSQGRKVCYYLSDYKAADAMLDKVMEQYARFAPEDMLLILVSAGEQQQEEELTYVRQMLERYESGKNIYFLPQMTPAVWQNADYFLAGINYETLESLDYAQDYGVKILSALDEDMFYWCGGGREYLRERVEAAEKSRIAVLNS